MKKKFIVVIACIISFGNLNAVGPITIGTAIKIIGGIGTIYGFLPEAEYTVEYSNEGNIKTDKYNSSKQALIAAKVALQNGSEYATIYSTYLTVHSSCNNKTYRKSDIPYIDRLLGTNNNVFLNEEAVISALFRQKPRAEYIVISCDDNGEVIVYDGIDFQRDAKFTSIRAYSRAMIYLKNEKNYYRKAASFVMIISKNNGEACGTYRSVQEIKDAMKNR